MTVAHDDFDPDQEPPEDDSELYYSRDLYDLSGGIDPYADVPWPGQLTPEEQEAHDLDAAKNWQPKTDPLPDIKVIDIDELQRRRSADLTATRATLEADGKVMRHYTAAELIALPRRFEWLARGWLTRPTYGMLAGEEKTLKTYVNLFMSLALADGQPIFGRFDVPHAVPVVAYVGEGGRVPYTNRLERVAQALKIDTDNIPYIMTFDVAAVTSEKFQLTLRHDLEEFRPGLVTLDPLYAFHGTRSDPRNLHDEGALLSSISAPCTEANACLQVVNHYNKTGNGKGLNRITMSGAKEWVDTWTLISHRAIPDVEGGQFKLLLEIGSRQWGGTAWDLDIDLGRFNPDTGEHDGDIQWAMHPHLPDLEMADDKQAARILELITDEPLGLTKTLILRDVTGNSMKARATFDRLANEHHIVSEMHPLPDARGRTTKRPVWRLAGTHPDGWENDSASSVVAMSEEGQFDV